MRNKIVQRVAFTLYILATVSALLAAEERGRQFAYTYTEGEQYRIVSEVEQTLSVNGTVLQQNFQLNRLQVKVEEVQEVPRGQEGQVSRAYHELTYQNSIDLQTMGQVYQRGREYQAAFWRDSQGYYDINEIYYVPTVQNVPVFPDHELRPGDSWNAEGIEVHDLREGFMLEEPFRFSMPVSYRYEGLAEWEGRSYDLILIDYQVYYPTGLPQNPDHPRLVTGYSSQKMYWDSERGRPAFYEEEYEISLLLYSRDLFTFSGVASARVLNSDPLDREETREELMKELAQKDLADVSVRETDEGLSLVLEDLQFLPDSSMLVPGELAKLEKIAEILGQYPDRDILVTGHTALAGTAEGRQALSEERSQIIAQFLLEQGVRDITRITYRGVGAEDPIADNNTEEGRRRNRRVEIIILEN